MASRLTRALTATVTLACLWSASPTAAGQRHDNNDPKKSAAESVAGRWSLNVEGGPHGAVSMGLALEQNGTKVKGTFESPHGDSPVEGEFTDGTLKLATAGGGDVDVTFSGRLKADGTLAGYLSSPMGDMSWTATRVKDRRDDRDRR